MDRRRGSYVYSAIVSYLGVDIQGSYYIAVGVALNTNTN